LSRGQLWPESGDAPARILPPRKELVLPRLTGRAWRKTSSSSQSHRRDRPGAAHGVFITPVLIDLFTTKDWMIKTVIPITFIMHCAYIALLFVSLPM
jgi:hypothetical protein